MRSKLFLGTSAGFIGALVMAVLIYLFQLAGINVRLLTAVSELSVKGTLVGTFWGNTIGLIAHFMCGSIVGIGILAVLEITGYTNIILKGAVLGGLVWFLLCGILARILNINMPGDFSGTVSNLLIHIVYGITVSVFIIYQNNRMAKQTIIR